MFSVYHSNKSHNSYHRKVFSARKPVKHKYALSHRMSYFLCIFMLVDSHRKMLKRKHRLMYFTVTTIYCFLIQV